MFISTEDIILLLEAVRAQPMNVQETDFIGNLWNSLTKQNPRITNKQYNYLKSLANRKILNDKTEITDNGS